MRRRVDCVSAPGCALPRSAVAERPRGLRSLFKTEVWNPLCCCALGRCVLGKEIRSAQNISLARCADFGERLDASSTLRCRTEAQLMQ